MLAKISKAWRLTATDLGFKWSLRVGDRPQPVKCQKSILAGTLIVMPVVIRFVDCRTGLASYAWLAFSGHLESVDLCACQEISLMYDVVKIVWRREPFKLGPHGA